MLRLICNENVVSFVSRSVGLVICTQALHHLVRNSQAGVYRGIKNKDTLTKKRMTVIETLSEMKAEGQTIDKTSTIDTFSTHNDVIVRPDRTSFD
mmetsp:Transcript_11993/g.17215  ORF Transcript_11993/g.17215 Transcript_11993/m.17215 type:complete len:95 (-) Transcript_11993:46-330(-)